MKKLLKFGTLGLLALLMCAQSTHAASKKSLPIVTITVDDNPKSWFVDPYTNVATNAPFKVLHDLGLTATLYVITGSMGSNAKEPQWREASWDDLKAAVAAGDEIGAHTVDHLSLPKIDPNKLGYQMDGPIDSMLKFLKVRPVSFALPFGETNDVVNAAIKGTYDGDGKVRYESVMTAENNASVSKDSFNPMDGSLDPYNIKRVIITDNTTTRAVCGKTGYLETAIAEHEWLVLGFHNVLAQMPQAGSDYVVTQDDFKSFATCIAEEVKKGTIQVLTVKDAVNTILGQAVKDAANTTLAKQ